MGLLIGILASKASRLAGWITDLADSNTGTARVTQSFGLALDSSGNYYVAGSFHNSSAGMDGFITKYNSSGVIQWQRSLADSNVAASQLTAFNSQGVADSSGNVYFGGWWRQPSLGGGPGFLAKYNSSGAIQWQKTITDPNAASGQSDVIYTTAIDSSSNIYGSGYVSNSAQGNNALIIKYTNAGVLTWQRRLYNGALAAANQYEYTYGSAVHQSTGNVYIGGDYTTIGTDSRAFLAKYNSSGTIQWQKYLIDAASTKNTFITSLVVDSSENIYITGRARNSSNGNGMFIAKYNNAGTIQWQRYLSGNTGASSVNDVSYGIAIDSSNNLYITGYSSVGAGGSQGIVAKYNSSGTLLWQRAIKTGSSSSNFTFRSIVVNGTNNLVVSGYAANTANGYEAVTVFLPLDGSKLGTFVVNSLLTLTISIGTMVDTAGAMTDGAGVLTNDTTGLAIDGTGALTDAAGSLTNVKVVI